MSASSSPADLPGRRKRWAAPLLAAALGPWAPAWGYEPAPDLWIHGFLSQGAVHTDRNEFFGKSSSGASLDFTEIGVNASWLALPELRLAGQILSRRAGGGDDGNLRLDYGLIDWTAFSNDTSRAGLRLGRVKMPLGLYNETRDVAHTRPGILLPQSLYTDVQRNIVLSLDGVALYGERRTDLGDFFLDLQGGQLREDDLDDILTGSGGKTTASDTSTFLVHFAYERDSGRIRLGGYHMQADIDMSADTESLIPGASRLLPRIDGTFSGKIYGLYAQYNARLWGLTGEVQRIDSEIRDVTRVPGIGPLLPDQGYTTDNWYLQLTYRPAPRWELLLRYDETRNHDTGLVLPDGSVQPSRYPDYYDFACDWTFGVRWDATEQLMVRAEIHNVDGTAWLPAADNPDPALTGRHWNLFALEVAYRF